MSGAADQSLSEEDAYLDPDTIVLRSAGIDIGSATTHLVTSRITMKRLGRSHSSRYVIVDRQLEYMSPIVFTPYIDGDLIDATRLVDQLSEWIEGEEYGEDSIDTGVVMLTGEAMRRRNARQITEEVSRLAGDFVCAAAGDLFEVEMAAHGSGAVALSRTNGPILNIDIGGGTTKVSVCRDGEIVERGVLHMGARALVVDADDRITRIEMPGALASTALGLDVGLGDTLGEAAREKVAWWLTDRLDEYLRPGPTSAETEEMVIVSRPSLPDDISAVVFSSGVGEYIYGREKRNFGDLAPWIADAVRAKRDGGTWQWHWHVPEASPIRATVTGIAQQTVEMSGDTIYVGRPEALPMRNREVRTLDIASLAKAEEIVEAMKQVVALDSLSSAEGGVVWDVRCGGDRHYAYLAELARGLGEGGSVLGEGPVGLILDQDIAMLVGRLIAEELEVASDVVVLDGISLKDIHFVDFGRFRPETNTVPVVLKSLVFNDRENDPVALTEEV
ncbi:MAG TPA: ethanolamine ammonia-lyase reactivating factor EutA [Acidimicrobiia bacterium]|nr:ethanolamine ammonia-lyase reactivating factor EutA [Acidimicrobiia bacterium]